MLDFVENSDMTRMVVAGCGLWLQQALGQEQYGGKSSLNIVHISCICSDRGRVFVFFS